MASSSKSVRPDQALLARTMAAIAKVESGGSSNPYRAQSSTSSASGKYQYIDRTWGGYGGYSRAKDAPPALQEQRMARDTAAALARYGGDPNLVAVAHFQGGGVANQIAKNPSLWAKKDANGFTTRDYVATFSRWMGSNPPRSSGSASGQVDPVVPLTPVNPNLPTYTPGNVPSPPKVKVATLEELLKQASGVYTPTKLPTTDKVLAELTANRVQQMNQQIAGFDGAVAQARQRLLGQGDYAAQRINAIKGKINPQFDASLQQLLSGQAATAADLSASQGAQIAGGNADGTNARGILEAVGAANSGLLGEQQLADSTFAREQQANTGSILDLLAGSGASAIQQAGLANLETNAVQGQYKLRAQSDEKLADAIQAILQQAYEAQTRAALAEPGQQIDALRTVSTVDNNNAQNALAQGQLGLQTTQEANRVNEFGVTSGQANARIAIDAGDLEAKQAQTEESIRASRVGTRLDAEKETRIAGQVDRQIGQDDRKIAADSRRINNEEERIKQEDARIAISEGNQKLAKKKFDADQTQLEATNTIDVNGRRVVLSKAERDRRPAVEQAILKSVDLVSDPVPASEWAEFSPAVQARMLDEYSIALKKGKAVEVPVQLTPSDFAQSAYFGNVKDKSAFTAKVTPYANALAKVSFPDAPPLKKNKPDNQAQAEVLKQRREFAKNYTDEAIGMWAPMAGLGLYDAKSGRLTSLSSNERFIFSEVLRTSTPPTVGKVPFKSPAIPNNVEVR